MTDSKHLEESSKKTESYYHDLLKSLDEAQEIEIVKQEDLEQWEVYETLEELNDIFRNYRSGEYEYSKATADLLRLCAYYERMIPVIGSFRGSVKHFAELKKAQKAKTDILVKDKNLEDRNASSKVPKITDKTAESLSIISVKEFTKKIMEVEALSEVFTSYQNLILHFTTILNSILKRDFDSQNVNISGTKKLTRKSEDYLYESSEGAAL